MRHLRQLPSWLTIGTLVVAVVFVTVLLVVLRRDQGARARSETASDRVFRSALLPDEGWVTYGADVWSMGYPAAWSVAALDDGVAIVDDDGETQLTVREESRALGTIDATFDGDGSVTKSEFLFAAYPTIKYAHLSGREEYYVSYNDRVFAIVTDDAADEEIGIMLATFQFLY
ncbi:hypothetical protein HYS28_00855 [Candidatus Uhrbacteria bacterium]|nr:hypothetical protein [Candidatus Uhrbacteria bacterium]